MRRAASSALPASSSCRTASWYARSAAPLPWLAPPSPPTAVCVALLSPISALRLPAVPTTAERSPTAAMATAPRAPHRWLRCARRRRRHGPALSSLGVRLRSDARSRPRRQRMDDGKRTAAAERRGRAGRGRVEAVKVALLHAVEWWTMGRKRERSCVGSGPSERGGRPRVHPLPLLHTTWRATTAPRTRVCAMAWVLSTLQVQRDDASKARQSNTSLVLYAVAARSQVRVDAMPTSAKLPCSIHLLSTPVQADPLALAPCLSPPLPPLQSTTSPLRLTALAGCPHEGE